jgi:hypothetical protein
MMGDMALTLCPCSAQTAFSLTGEAGSSKKQKKASGNTNREAELPLREGFVSRLPDERCLRDKRRIFHR